MEQRPLPPQLQGLDIEDALSTCWFWNRQLMELPKSRILARQKAARKLAIATQEALIIAQAHGVEIPSQQLELYRASSKEVAVKKKPSKTVKNTARKHSSRRSQFGKKCARAAAPIMACGVFFTGFGFGIDAMIDHQEYHSRADQITANVLIEAEQRAEDYYREHSSFDGLNAEALQAPGLDAHAKPGKNADPKALYVQQNGDSQVTLCAVQTTDEAFCLRYDAHSGETTYARNHYDGPRDNTPLVMSEEGHFYSKADDGWW